MSDNSENAEIVVDGLWIIEQSRPIVAIWAKAVGAGSGYNRTAENLLLAKQTMERVARVAYALDLLIRHEEGR